MTTRAQQFFNLTAQEVAIDSVLPVFNYEFPLGRDYQDSTYRVTIDYPEFIDMSADEVVRYREISGVALQTLPPLTQWVTSTRGEGGLMVQMTPLVWRDGKYQKLVSFMLRKTATSLRRSVLRRATAADRYAANSVLASGRWVKVRVPSTGVYQLTDDLIRQAGFSSLSQVSVFGYGGALQPEVLTGDYLTATDDLHEVPVCEVDGKRLFYAVGPVSWDSSHQRTRNPYSDYGYYFLTEDGQAPQTIDWNTFVAQNQFREDDYNTLYEVDDYAWFQGGRNLYDAQVIATGTGRSYTLEATPGTAAGSITVVLSAYTKTAGASAQVWVNGTLAGTVSLATSGEYDAMRVGKGTFTTAPLQASNQVVVLPNANCGTVRLDYISLYSDQPKGFPAAAGTFPVPEYVGEVANQNHHADGAADMVIIIPASRKLSAQAERLRALHSECDALRVRVVAADELYNEFSSGTPDVAAYRRYLKMLYDRATTTADMPRYLLLLGDCAWDNRMVSSTWKGTSPDDYLLCYESDNSYSKTSCYVSDDYFCLLDDGKGAALVSQDKLDMAVGRIPARNVTEATQAVNKIVSYARNEQAGAWQNVVCFLGDDGNENQHMDDANAVATQTETLYPNLVVKRVMWDAYTRVSSSTGNSYPDATRIIKQQMQQGALMMNYSGHGGPSAMSHESVLKLQDFQTATSLRLPLWMTASCDLMPFDGQEDNIGETALFNAKGGAIAFYGTTRTVYQNQNRLMNLSFSRHVLDRDASGQAMAIGEAVRITKNELLANKVITGYDSSGNPIYGGDRTTNRLQYSLLGDPALRLAMPTRTIQIDAINETPLTSGTALTVPAGATATVKGRVLTADGQTDNTFNGTLTAVVRDVKELVTCRLNNTGSDGASTPFVYSDRLNNIFTGSNQVKDGEFTFAFAVPLDIKYSSNDGLINLYACNDAKTVMANGTTNQVVFNGTSTSADSERGPSIYCYLNSTSFSNGDAVNPTPFFVALINDEDGVNASGGGLGHDLQLVIDGDLAKTYALNDYFQYDFGSYTKGQIGFSLPQLSYGQHKLQFRAWDVLNNSSVTELTFNVVKGLEPVFVDVDCTPNPAKTQTRFRVVHDRIGSEMDVRLDIFDTSGRHLWTHQENGVPTDNSYVVDWDLTADGGRRLLTGLYLYRVSISSDGSSYVSKAKKLMILNK